MLEKLTGFVYKKWKQGLPKPEIHPSEEDLACFSEGRISSSEKENIKAHLIACPVCADCFAKAQSEGSREELETPKELEEKVLALVKEDKPFFLEIFLKLKAKTLEIIDTTGDVLVDREFVPAPILRSRSIKNFKDEVIILKDFKDIRVEAKIENKAGKAFDLSILARNKNTQKVLKDLRFTLVKEDLELESCLSEAGTVTFEHILLGKYKVEISSLEDKLASIIIDIKS